LADLGRDDFINLRDVLGNMQWRITTPACSRPFPRIFKFCYLKTNILKVPIKRRIDFRAARKSPFSRVNPVP